MIEIPLSKGRYYQSPFRTQDILKTADDTFRPTLHGTKALKRGMEQANITGDYSQAANSTADIASCNHSYTPKSFSAFS